MNYATFISGFSLLALAASSALGQTSYSTGFENFALGAQTNPIIGGVDGWAGNGSSGLSGGSQLDVEIVDLGGSTGNAMRWSNAVTSGNYATTHPTTPTLTPIGETAIGATPGTFSFAFSFMAAVDAFQSGLELDVTPIEFGSASRQGIVRIFDDAVAGLSVGWWEVNSGGFNFVTLASGLSRTAWHSVDVSMEIIDGSLNDVVTASVNTSSATVGTWEYYYETTPSQPPFAPVDSVIFRAGNFNNPMPGLAGGGIYIDDFSMTATPAVAPVVPEASTYGLIGAAALGLLIVVRRFKARK